MSDADLGVGIRGCIQAASEWPPSLPAFRAMCRPARRENAAMYRVPATRQLPHQLSDERRSEGRAAIAAIRATLKGGVA